MSCSSCSKGGYDDYKEDSPGFRLHIGDLNSSASKRDLEKAFGKFGLLKEIWMARSVPCFAFVVFCYQEDGEDAMCAVNGSEIKGKRIKVTVDKPRTRGRMGMILARNWQIS